MKHPLVKSYVYQPNPKIFALHRSPADLNERNQRLFHSQILTILPNFSTSGLSVYMNTLSAMPSSLSLRRTPRNVLQKLSQGNPVFHHFPLSRHNVFHEVSEGARGSRQLPSSISQEALGSRQLLLPFPKRRVARASSSCNSSHPTAWRLRRYGGSRSSSSCLLASPLKCHHSGSS